MRHPAVSPSGKILLLFTAAVFVHFSRTARTLIAGGHSSRCEHHVIAGGAGGCPFAPRATGNIPMDDLVFMLEGMGITTGVNLDALIETTHWFEELLQRPLPAMLPKAGPCWKAPPPLAQMP